MGKNKPIRNPFFFYVQEFKSQRPKAFETQQEFFQAAGPYWSALTPEQRRPYEEMAAKDKQGRKVVKYTSSGVDINIVEQRNQEKLAKQQKMNDDIDSMINVAVNTGRIAEELFYIIHVNYFCQYTNNLKYVPAELAVARFTLKDGVTSENVFHIIVRSGKLQLGYSSECKERSENTHKLPPPSTFDNEENNMATVLSGLKAFMREMHPTGWLPPVFTDSRNVDKVENVLDTLIYDYGGPHETFRLRIYTLDYFFYSLRNAVSGRQVWPQISNSIMELQKDEYDFCLDVTCSFHAVSDAPNHCSKSHAMRTVYLICDNCCEDLQIELIPGQHVPKNANVVSTRPPSRASSVASSYVTARSIARQSTLREEEYLSTTEGFLSETNTLIDPDESASVDFSQNESAYTDEENWIQPKQRPRNRQLPYQSSPMPSNHSQDSAPSNSSQGTDSRNRRPFSMSAALSGLSIGSSPRGTGIRSMTGRGRGRGFSDKI